MKNKTRSAVFAILAGLASTQTASAFEAILSNDLNGVGVKGQTFDILGEEIRKRLPDAKVEVHHSGALFDQKTQIQGLQLGSAHLIAPTSGIYATVAPGVNALTLPFLLSTPEQIMSAMADETVRSAFAPALEAKNIVPVAVWMNGPRELAYKGSKPIFVPADMKGVKIRVQSVPADIATMEATGANVISMSWSEVPTALQQGVIDAVEPTPNALSGAGLIETIDQMTRFGYQYSFYIVGANKQWWDGMSDEERAAVQSALDVATAWNLENAAQENQKGYDAVIAAGKPINDLTDAQREEWVSAMKTVWAEFGDKTVGPEVMARLEEISRQ